MLDNGSASSKSTRAPAIAVAADRLIEVVVLPTPPFWLVTRSFRTAPPVLQTARKRKKGMGWTFILRAFRDPCEERVAHASAGGLHFSSARSSGFDALT